MEDLLGYAALSLVSLITLIIALKWPSISNILFTALILRVFVMLMGHYFITLPDSTADSVTFEKTAWSIAEGGFFNLSKSFPDQPAKIISWLIAIPYSLFGRSMLMSQAISLFVGMGSIFFGWLLAKKIWNDHTANKVGWTMALFPSLILYSVLFLREVYVCFFLIVAIFGIVNWFKKNNLISLVLAVIGFIGATVLHGAMFVGFLIFITFVGVTVSKKFFKSLIHYKINMKMVFIFILFIIGLQFFVTSKIKIPYIGSFDNFTNPETLKRQTSVSNTGEAAWPEWTKINSNIEIIYKAPIRSLYFVFSPFPWDVKKSGHLVGMLDGILYLYLVFLILINLKVIWRNPTLRMVLIILLAYIFVFSFGVGNFGTGIRHRSKLVIMFIFLAAPLIKRFIFFKKTDKIQ